MSRNTRHLILLHSTFFFFNVIFYYKLDMNKCDTGRIDLLYALFISLVNIFNASICIILVTGISRFFFFFSYLFVASISSLRFFFFGVNNIFDFTNVAETSYWDYNFLMMKFNYLGG